MSRYYLRIGIACTYIGLVVGELHACTQGTVREPNFLPPMKTIPREELKPLLETWDKAVASDKNVEKERVLVQVAHYISEQDCRFRGSYMLGYDNPEIKRRVIDLYVKECAKPTEAEPSPTNPWYYGEGEYQELFMSLAESTFDPNIYKTVLNPPEYFGGLRILYLATVNAERTLNVLFKSTLGKRMGKPITPPDYFYHGEMAWGMSVEEAFQLLSFMSIQSPEVLRRHRTEVLSFVRRHVKHFAAPRTVDYKPEPVYLKMQDYDVRNGALDVLEFLGTSDDVGTVEDIVRDAPRMDAKELIVGKKGQREQLGDKAARIIALLQQREGRIHMRSATRTRR